MYLGFDCETGGIVKGVSVLTASFEVLDKEMNILDEIDFKLIPDDGIYRVQPEGMAVNKIDLVELAKEAIPYKDAQKLLGTFLEKNYRELGKKRLIPFGQNVVWDVEYVRESITVDATWFTFVERRVYDTMMFARILQLEGKLPLESVSLKNLIAYFEIEVEGDLHDAKIDLKATKEVYKRLRTYLK